MERLFARLSDRYHLIAPDYPGFGHSDWPDPRKFAYTFDHLAETMNHFTEALGLSRYTLYMQDYGGPVGFRMALEHPERTEALIVQDAVAHNEGLGANWKTRRASWGATRSHWRCDQFDSRPGKSILTVPGELSAMRSLTSPVRKLSALGTKRPQVLNRRCEILSWTAKSLKDMVARDGVEPPTPAFSGL